MKKNQLTFKMYAQINGLYMLQVLDGALMIKEERNLEYEEAVNRIEEIKGERNAAKQGTGAE